MIGERKKTIKLKVTPRNCAGDGAGQIEIKSSISISLREQKGDGRHITAIVGWYTSRSTIKDEIRTMLSRIWITLVIIASVVDVGLVWWVMNQLS